MSQSQQTIEPWLRDILRCPRCKGELTDDAHEHEGASTPELRCAACRLGYPIEGGVPVLLEDLARRLDG